MRTRRIRESELFGALHSYSFVDGNNMFIKMATKSAFAEHLQHFFPHFRRCNQDDLGARRTVEQLAQESLNQGLSVCIDRTNFNLA